MHKRTRGGNLLLNISHKVFTNFHDIPECKKTHDGPEGVASQAHYYVSNQLFFFFC